MLLRDAAFQRGARSLLSDYVQLRERQSAVFVYDREVGGVAIALECIAASAGACVRCVRADLPWDTIAADLAPGADAVLFLEAGESHHTQAMLRHLATHPHPPRAYRLFGATADTLRSGFRRRRETLRRRNRSLIARARQSGSLRVESDRGTRLRVGFDRAAWWVNTYGECAGGYPGILPPSEVNTRSADIDGVLVVDGAIGSNVGWPLDARLAKHPVTLRISRGTISDVSCAQRLVRDLIEEFLRVPQCNEVVEIGIGTNDGIRAFVADDILLNERVASFHLGVGSADAPRAEQNLHLDFMLGDCRLLFGGDVVLKNGRFLLPPGGPSSRDGDMNVMLHDAL